MQEVKTNIDISRNLLTVSNQLRAKPETLTYVNNRNSKLLINLLKIVNRNQLRDSNNTAKNVPRSVGTYLAVPLVVYGIYDGKTSYHKKITHYILRSLLIAYLLNLT